ncbi:MAG: hypothetical protein DRJ05_12800, partial [Bacteroidetes bacterium]
EIIENTYSVLRLTNSISNFYLSEVSTAGGMFLKIQIPGHSKSLTVGNPELPVIKRLIEIPFGAHVESKIIYSSFRDYNLADLGFSNVVIPARAPLLKNIDNPESVEYIFNSNTYSKNSFSRQENVTVEILGTMRGVRIGRIEIAPIQYNPVSNMLRVFYEMEIEITFTNADIPLTKSSKNNLFSPFYENIYSKIINYKALGPDELITDSPVTYVIVSDPMFNDMLQPFIHWKTKKGFRVITAYTDDPQVGNTTSSIKGYLENLYNNPPEGFNPQSFILFVGDVAQIPAFMGIAGNHVTDLYYAEYTGDIFPECYYGRFSANNLDELEPQLTKTLEYETYQFPESDFLDTTILIAGLAPGYDTLWGNGQINYLVENYLNPDNNIFPHIITPPFSPDTNYTNLIIEKISNGSSFVNYTGHCGIFGFINPVFSIANIPDLTNEHRYPLVVGNCCSSASFHTMSFGEEFVRAENKGALSFIGAANLTYWDEDYWWMVGFKEISSLPPFILDNPGLADRWFHLNGEPINEWYITQGQLPAAGNLAITQSGSSLEAYYWEVYNLLGDPSVMIYIPEPELPFVDFPLSIAPETEIVDVETEPYLYVAISKEGILHGAAIADENGIAGINIFEPFTESGIADIVVTGQNKEPFFGSIVIESDQGAYVLLSSFSIDDTNGNNDGMADAGENILLDVTLHNFGNIASDNLTATLLSADTNINILNNVNTWSSLDPGNSEILFGAFSFDVGEYFLNGHIADFNVEITNGNETWNSDFTILLHSTITNLTEINHSEPITNLSIYPNPFSTQLTITYELSKNSDVSISIIDLVGKQHLFIKPDFLQSSGKQNTVLNTANFPPGIYLCKIQSGSFTLIRRIILAR